MSDPFLDWLEEQEALDAAQGGAFNDFTQQSWGDKALDFVGNALSNLTTPAGIGALIGGGLSLYGANTQQSRPTGYQGAIPIYGVSRQQVPYDYTSEAAMGVGGPGSLGRNYFSDTIYSMPPGLSESQINSIQATGLNIPSYQQAKEFSGIQADAMFNQGDRTGVGSGPYTPIPSSANYSTMGLTSMVPSAAEMDKLYQDSIYGGYMDTVQGVYDLINARNEILSYHDTIGLEATDESLKSAMQAYIGGASMDEVYAIIDGYAPVPKEVPAEEVTTSGSDPLTAFSDSNPRSDDARTVDDVSTRYDDYLEETGRNTIDPVTYGPIEPVTWTGRPPEMADRDVDNSPIESSPNESDPKTTQTRPDPRPVEGTTTEGTTTTETGRGSTGTTEPTQPQYSPPPELSEAEIQELFKDRFVDVARIKKKYQSFGRAPTQEETIFWLYRLNDPEFSIVDLSRAFKNNSEEGIASLVEQGIPSFAGGGLANLKSYYLGGVTDGMADKIPASIENRDPARLSDGEFVVPADVVSHLGNGNSNAGAKQLYNMMDRIRKARTGSTEQGKQINPNSYLPN